MTFNNFAYLFDLSYLGLRHRTFLYLRGLWRYADCAALLYY